MLAPPSSRTVDPRLAAASGVMRDTVGAVHNLQHLLGSVKVGPKALSRVVPDVHASCAAMVAAAWDLVRGAEGGKLAAASAALLGELLVARTGELSSALGHMSASSFRASDRLTLEGALLPVVRDLDGALELVELIVESSAKGRVPVAVSDVIREAGSRPDTSSGRGRRLRVTFTADSALSVRVNPRLALRLFAFAVALTPGKDGVHTHATVVGERCVFRLSSPSDGGDTLTVAVPALIELSRKCASEVAKEAEGRLDGSDDEPFTLLSLPLDPGE